MQQEHTYHLPILAGIENSILIIQYYILTRLERNPLKIDEQSRTIEQVRIWKIMTMKGEKNKLQKQCTASQNEYSLRSVLHYMYMYVLRIEFIHTQCKWCNRKVIYVYTVNLCYNSGPYIAHTFYRSHVPENFSCSFLAAKHTLDIGKAPETYIISKDFAYED